MRVVDAQGRVLDLPDEQAWKGLQGGEFGLEPGAEVPVRNQIGGVVKVKAEDLGAALNQQYQPASEAEWKQAEQRAEHETLPGFVASNAAALARGGTLGISDAAIVGIGGKQAQEALNAYRDIFPVSNTISEVGGALVPMFLSGGGSAAATGTELAATGAREASLLGRGLQAGGRLLTAPVRWQQGLGTLAEHGAQALLGAPEAAGFASRAARTIIPDMARGVAEGAVQGIGNSITEHALGNKDLTVEGLISNIGHGAIMGGALGGGIGTLRFGAGEAKGLIARMLSGGATDSLPSGRGVSTESNTSAGVRSTDDLNVNVGGTQLKATLSDIHTATHGTDPEVAAALRSQERRAIGLRNADTEADRLAMQAAEHYNKGSAATDVIQDQVLRGTAKDAQMAKLVDETRIQPALQQSHAVLEDLNSFRDALAKDPLVDKKLLGRVNQLADGWNIKLSQAAAAEEGAVGKLFAELDNLKYDIGKLASKTKGQYGAMLEGLYNDSVKVALENEAAWSKAALSQQTINPVYSKWIGLQRRASDIVEYGTGLKKASDSFDELYQADPSAYKSTFKQIGGAESYAKMQVLRDAADAQRELAEATEKAYKLTPAQKSLVEDMRKSTEAYHGVVREADSNMGLIRKFAEDEAKTVNPVAESVRGIPGAGPVLSMVLSTGPVSVARRTDAVLALGQRIKTLVGIESIAKASSQAATESVKQIFTTPVQRVQGPGKREASFSAVSPAIKLLGATREDRQKSYEQRRKELEATVKDPTRAMRAANHIAQDAPQLAELLAKKLYEQSAYLLSKAPVQRPKSPAQPNIKLPASDGDIAKFAQVLAAVDDPKMVMEAIGKGTATKDMIRAFKDNNAQTYKAMQEAVQKHVDAMDARGESLPYEQRVKLSALLDIPADPSFEPSFASAIAAHYAATKQAQAQAVAKMKAPAGSGGKLRTDRFGTASADIESGLGD